MTRKRVSAITGAIIFLQLFAGCAASSSQLYSTWSLSKGITKNKAGELVPATVFDMMVGTGLLNIDPNRPDWGKIYQRVQDILDHEDRYHFCPNGYKIVPDSIGFERHGTYVMVAVICK
jgi:hypothetical protein